MARTPRIQYSGAIYHVMARGNRRENIVLSDDDRWMFLHTLGEMADRTGIKVHAFALMNNHYHLVLETPRANLVDGMQWFQNAYTRRFNVKNKVWGHLFGGRYKAILVQSDEGNYFSTLIDYVHLNPVRAGLVKQGQGFDGTRWTSLREYRKPPSKRQPWMCTEAGFNAMKIEDTTRGRKAYVERLENLIDWNKPNDSGKVFWEGQSLQSTLKRGWYFGAQEFRDKMLNYLEKGKLKRKMGEECKTRNRYTSGELKDYDKRMAETIVRKGLKLMKVKPEALQKMPKNAATKALLAHVLCEQTSVSQKWITKTLHMGSSPYVSKLAKEMKLRVKNDKKWANLKKDIIRFIT